MRSLSLLLSLLCLALPRSVSGQAPFQTDTIKTAGGDLKITFLGHATLYCTFRGSVIHVDPVRRYADYTKLPKADLILVTHEHGDHFDPKAIETISTEKTHIVLTQICYKKLQKGIVMKNGDRTIVKGLSLQAVPAYNIVHMRRPGVPYHPKGRGNGYVITFGDRKVYIAGDTENVPEMAKLKDIYCAFLPMNVPYTMTPEMVAAAARVIKPTILYPYHFGRTDTSKLVELLKDEKGIDVRIRKMQ